MISGTLLALEDEICPLFEEKPPERRKRKSDAVKFCNARLSESRNDMESLRRVSFDSLKLR